MTLNPYEAPKPAPPPAGGQVIPIEPIRFEGNVRFRDVERLGRDFLKEPARFISCLIAAIPALHGLALIVVQFRSGRPIDWLDAVAWVMFATVKSGLAAVVIYLLLYYILGGFVGLQFARTRRRLTPRLIGNIRGKLDHRSVELQYGDCRSVMLLESICGLRLTRHAIGLTFMPHRYALVVLPKSIFLDDGFGHARRLLEPLARERPLRPGFSTVDDPRLVEGEPLRLIERPEHRVDFSGTLTAGDLVPPSTFGQWLRQIGLREALRVGFLFVFVVGIDYLVSGQVTGLSFIVLPPLVAFIVVRMGVLVRRTRRLISDPQRPVASFSGWLAGDELTVNLPIGCSVYLPSAFERVSRDEQVVRLHLPGRLAQQIVLARRFFCADDDFEAAVRWSERIPRGYGPRYRG